MAGNKIYVQGSYIDVHDNENVYLSVDKAEVRVADGISAEGTTGRERPERLKTDEARALMKDLVAGGLLDEDWQPRNLSGTERALVAKAVCERLKINEVWQVFGKLWGEKPETLRN